LKKPNCCVALGRFRVNVQEYASAHRPSRALHLGFLNRLPRFGRYAAVQGSTVQRFKVARSIRLCGIREPFNACVVREDLEL
jgi:hypothetical protein